MSSGLQAGAWFEHSLLVPVGNIRSCRSCHRGFKQVRGLNTHCWFLLATLGAADHVTGASSRCVFCTLIVCSGWEHFRNSPRGKIGSLSPPTFPLYRGFKQVRILYTGCLFLLGTFPLVGKIGSLRMEQLCRHLC